MGSSTAVLKLSTIQAYACCMQVSLRSVTVLATTTLPSAALPAHLLEFFGTGSIQQQAIQGQHTGHGAYTQQQMGQQMVQQQQMGQQQSSKAHGAVIELAPPCPAAVHLAIQRTTSAIAHGSLLPSLQHALLHAEMHAPPKPPPTPSQVQHNKQAADYEAPGATLALQLVPAVPAPGNHTDLAVAPHQPALDSCAAASEQELAMGRRVASLLQVGS